MQITQSKTRSQFPLSRKKIWKKTIASIFIWVIVFVVLLGFPFLEILMSASATVSNTLLTSAILHILLPVIVLAIIVFILIYIYQRWYFSVYYYDLTDNFVIIKKGPIAPQEITIPYERIQDVYVDQDIWDRMFGLYDVHLSSATFASGREAHIDGVEKEAADGLKNLLLTTIQQKMGHAKAVVSSSVSSSQ